MSIQGDRQAIADALSTVDGVTGHKYRPTVMRGGAGWPLVQDLQRGPALDFDVTWRVVVVLPAGEQQASEWFDENHEALAEALDDFGHVERIEPTSIVTDAGDMDGMLITLRKEA